MAMTASSWGSSSIQQELAKPAAWSQSWQIRCVDKGVVHKVPLTSSYVRNTFHDELGPKCLLTRICEAHVTQTTLANVIYKFHKILINMLMTFSYEKKHIHLIPQMTLITKVLTPKIKARYYGILFQFKMATTKGSGNIMEDGAERSWAREPRRLLRDRVFSMWEGDAPVKPQKYGCLHNKCTKTPTVNISTFIGKLSQDHIPKGRATGS